MWAHDGTMTDGEASKQQQSHHDEDCGLNEPMNHELHLSHDSRLNPLYLVYLKIQQAAGAAGVERRDDKQSVHSNHHFSANTK